MSNPNPSKPFVKGDPRINRKGRPRNFDALRELAQQIAHETTNAIIDGHKVTVAEAILRQWAISKNPQLQRAFIEIAFGKVPDALQLMGKDGDTLKIIVEYADDNSPEIGAPSPGATAD